MENVSRDELGKDEEVTSSTQTDTDSSSIHNSTDDRTHIDDERNKTAEEADGNDPGVLEAQKEAAARSDNDRAHSAFGKREKLFIVTMVTMASFFSPLSGQIYYPVMPSLITNYHLTTALINLSITTYMILQGLAPAFMGTFADTSGRRPAYILAFTIYTAANIGLALQNNYPALLILRCVQSAGSSGTVAFGYGVIADVTTPAERGKYIGPMAAGAMVAPALGPVIGGLLSKFLGWRSVFWFLVIISGSYLVLYIVFVPETARSIVGDGSVPPKEWWRMSVQQYVAARWRLKQMPEHERQESEASRISPHAQNRRRRVRCPNPLHSAKILLEKDAIIIIFYVGLAMFANIALLTSIPNLFGSLYGFNTLQIGLCFLPLGISACIAAFVNGKILDWNYRRTAHKLGFSVDKRKGDDLRRFPIERVRLQNVFPAMALGCAAFLPYGWVLQQHAPLVAPLILQFIIGFCFIASLNTLNTMLVDLFPDRAATAASACNLVRCWLGAVGAAVIDQMLVGMGWGWAFTFLGLVLAAALGMLWWERSSGMKWREERFLRMDRKKEVRSEQK